MGEMADYYLDRMLDDDILAAMAESAYQDMIWTMQDGTQVFVHDMTDSHIRACIRLLQRRGYTGHLIYMRLKEELMIRKAKPWSVTVNGKTYSEEEV